MAFHSGFFNSKNLDRVYTAENFTEYLSSLICDGIHDNYGQCFEVKPNGGLTVTIGTGKAWINGHYFINDSPYVIDLNNYAEMSLSRYVIIGICCNTNEYFRNCDIVTEPGASAASPTVPSFMQASTETYLTLAAVYLPAGANTITLADIIDYRDNESKCGYVKCILGKCGVTELQTQFSELEMRLMSLETQVSGIASRLDSLGGSDCNCGDILADLEARLNQLEDTVGGLASGGGTGGGIESHADHPNILYSLSACGSTAQISTMVKSIIGVNAKIGLIHIVEDEEDKEES